MIDEKIYRKQYADLVLKRYGYEYWTFFDLHEDLQVFILAMVMQEQRTPMPDITPTNFGISVYKKIIKSNGTNN